MKKTITYITAIIFIAIAGAKAQSSLRPGTNANPPQKTNFFEMREAMNKYFAEHPEEMGKTDDETGGAFSDGAYEKFKRWEYYWENHVTASGEFVSPLKNIEEWKAYNEKLSARRNDNQSVASANWTAFGPSTSPGGYNGIGRINCIGFHPTNSNIMWAGTPAGGLWKTTNGGSTWTPTNINEPVVGVTDIAVDPNNPNTIYIATGDGESGSLSNLVGGVFGSGDSKSVGVLKSLDGGITWNSTGLNWTIQDQRVTHRLLINPNNPQILILAASDGIYRTTNGGNTWTQVANGAQVKDMEFHPTNPDIVYAATFSYPDGNAQIYTSTDGGINFFPASSFTGAARISMAVSPAWPDLVDCVLSNAQGGLIGLNASQDAGQSFSEYFTGSCSNNMLNGSTDASGCDGQGWYDLTYAINPLDANEIWLGAVNLYATSDGGGNWNMANYWIDDPNVTGVPIVHADKHFFAFQPGTNAMFQGNDGGIYKSTNGGNSWTHITNGIQNSQMYRISVSQTQPNVAIAGLQDNGSKLFANGSWSDVTGGDGTDCAIDPSNVNIQYAGYVNGRIYRTMDGWATQYTTISDNIPGQPSGGWVTPLVIFPGNSSVLIAGLDKVYGSNDRGDSWVALSPQLAGSYLKHLAVCSNNVDHIAVTTNDSLFLTSDQGATWTPVSFDIPGANISYVVYRTNDPQTIYITLSGYVAGQKVYMTTDGGNNWTNISGSLPNVPVNCILHENNAVNGLYVGTDLGVFYVNDNLPDWTPFNDNLPVVPVVDLDIYYTTPVNQIWAGTFGRGLWRTSGWVGITDPEAISNSFSLFPNPAVGEFEVIIKNPMLSVKQLTILNQLGEVVLTIDRPVTQEGKINIDLDGLANGVYVVNLLTNQTPVVKKLVISR